VMDAANAADFYVVIVCRDGEQCAEVLEALGTNDQAGRYVSAELVLNALDEAYGIDGDEDEDAEDGEPDGDASAPDDDAPGTP
jgi:hypothetical protein